MAISRVLLTGSTGFLGRVVASKLLEEGYEVIGTVRPASTGENQNGVIYRLLDLAGQVGWDDMPHDVAAIVHCAAVIPECFDDLNQIESLWRVNVQGTLRLLQWAKSNDVSRFIYCSSHSVYARPLPLPVPETHRTYPAGRATPYSLSKLAGEVLVTSMNSPEMLTCSLRLSSVFGPKMKASGVITRFIRQAVRQQPIVISAHPETQLDLVHVNDVAMAIVQALTLELHYPIYNLGSGHGTTLMDLAEATVTVFSPSKSVKINLAARYPPPMHNVLDISRARADLGYQPFYDTQSGMQSMQPQTRTKGNS